MAGSIILAVKSVFDDKGLKNAQREFSSVGKKLKGVLAGVGLGVGIGAIVGSLSDATKGFEKAQVASSKLANVLDSMGVGFATDRVDAYAESLQNTLAIDADIIKATQTKLATFSELTKTIGESGGAFDRATVAALDLAAAGFGTAEGNAVQLGKALQDPIKGLTSLSKSGVTFTAAEKEKIKTLVQSNQVLEAQNIVLEAIEKQVGGTAEAGVSQFTRLQLIFDSMADQIGSVLLPYVRQFADYLASPAGQEQMRQLAEAIAAVILGLSQAILWIIENRTALEALAIVVSGLVIGFGVLNGVLAIMRLRALGAASAQAILDIALGAVNPAALVIGFTAIALTVAELASTTASAADEQERLNKASGDYVPPAVGGGGLQASPTGGPANFPKNPKPGEVYTWFNYSDRDNPNLAIWWQQTWDGKTWSKPERMTYTPAGGGGSGKSKNAFAEFSKKLLDDAKKLRAIGVLTGKGLSEGFAEAIVSSGDQWVTTYNKIVSMGKTALAALQKQFNATSKGQQELTEAKQAEYEKQKKADEEYADSVKSTFTDIRESIMGAFDITQMGKTAGGLLRNVNKLIAQTKAFADNIRSLAGQGLNTQLLNQLIMAGPMEGGRLAASLASSGAGAISQLNTGYAQFQGLSTDIAAYGTLSQFGDKANPVINVTVNAGMGTDGAAVGKQVVDAILKYERTTGKIFARA